MIGLLHQILDAVRRVLAGQQSAEDSATTRQDALEARLSDLSAAVEHLRVLVEGDTTPTAVGVPTFTPQE